MSHDTMNDCSFLACCGSLHPYACSSDIATFGYGLSSGSITPKEQHVFQHNVAPGDVGVMTHFWITYEHAVCALCFVCCALRCCVLSVSLLSVALNASQADYGTIIRYYVDGETNASIVFTPSLACGVGFHDAQAPWGTKWFGKGAKDGGTCLREDR